MSNVINNEKLPENSMTSFERLSAAFTGQKVDRVPIWFREGFPEYKPLPEKDDFLCGWMSDPLYCELYNYIEPHADFFLRWGCSSLNRMLMAPYKSITTKVKQESDNLVRITNEIRTGSKTIYQVYERKRGTNTSWCTKHAVESLEDLYALANMEFETDEEALKVSLAGYNRAVETGPKRGIPSLFISSPIATISGTMPFQLFLELSLLEKELFHRLLEETTRRILLVLEKLFELGNITGVVTLGGSEQCTPPMMNPEAYDEFVTPCDVQIIDFLHSKGILVNIHCHGKVRHALGSMVRIKADGTDPVEPSPAGDVTYAEAREIVGDNLTLLGNIESHDFEHSTTSDIRNKVKEILRHGNRRLILANSAGPISAVSRKLVDNYKAWLDAALEFGT